MFAASTQHSSSPLLAEGLELAVLLQELVGAQEALLQASAALGATCTQ